MFYLWFSLLLLFLWILSVICKADIPLKRFYWGQFYGTCLPPGEWSLSRFSELWNLFSKYAYARSVWKVASHFEYPKNQLRGIWCNLASKQRKHYSPVSNQQCNAADFFFIHRYRFIYNNQVSRIFIYDFPIFSDVLLSRLGFHKTARLSENYNHI